MMEQGTLLAEDIDCAHAARTKHALERQQAWHVEYVDGSCKACETRLNEIVGAGGYVFDVSPLGLVQFIITWWEWQ
jgi:hypothetical protein